MRPFIIMTLAAASLLGIAGSVGVQAAPRHLDTRMPLLSVGYANQSNCFSANGRPRLDSDTCARPHVGHPVSSAGYPTKNAGRNLDPVSGWHRAVGGSGGNGGGGGH